VAKESRIDVLVRFARLASEAGTGSAILPLLADALVEQVGADGVAILELKKTGRVELLASKHLPTELEGVAIDPDASGAELGAALRKACNGRFAHVWLHPLVSGGGLFGTVAMFFARERPSERLDIAEGLVDLAAISLGADAKLQELARSHAELRASQDALARTEKLRALGQMAAGVSHDLKNILSPLSLHLQLVDRSIKRAKSVEAIAADVGDSIDQMKQVLTRGLQTIERLRDYSRQAPESRAEMVDLDRLVHEAGEIARPRIAAHKITTQLKEELGAPPAVFGRSGDIVSAIVNLVINAIDAGGSTITLRTGATTGTSWVQIADDGPGMSPEIQERVFEPFFTTKGEEGTGLGLPMVYACMQRHGGAVKLESTVGAGTTFTLTFPSAPAV
jgi:signal transduction histidine kinase